MNALSIHALFDAIHNYCVADVCCLPVLEVFWSLSVEEGHLLYLQPAGWPAMGGPLYGEMVITNRNQCSCKLMFVKVLLAGSDN